MTRHVSPVMGQLIARSCSWCTTSPYAPELNLIEAVLSHMVGTAQPRAVSSRWDEGPALRITPAEAGWAYPPAVGWRADAFPQEVVPAQCCMAARVACSDSRRAAESDAALFWSSFGSVVVS